jgi:hypothetical protein
MVETWHVVDGLPPEIWKIEEKYNWVSRKNNTIK